MPLAQSAAEAVSMSLGYVSVAAADYIDCGVTSQVLLRNLNFLQHPKAASKNLYGVIVSRGTPTYSGVSDLQVKPSYLQD